MDQQTSQIDLSNVEQLSDAQEKALALLPLPSALLSIFGSSVIIYIACNSRREQKWTPYTRLLIMMSISDILFSSTIGIGSFLRPRETSTRAWAFGTASTCSAVGFLNQLATSSVLYNAMLSAYFLLTARFNFKNSFIASTVEPWMHFVCIGFPLLTATVGAAVGEYGEMTVNGLVCWLVKFPTNCGYGPGESGKECLSKFVGWVFYGLPVLITFVAIITNSFILVLFVQKQALPPSDKRNGISAQTRRDQRRRLRLVRTQACLFLASFTVCIFWTGVLNSVESMASTKEEELSLMARVFPLSVIQAIFMPLQGFLNMFVYIRPKFLKVIHEFPNESRIWAIRRSIFGDEITPTRPLALEAKVELAGVKEKSREQRQKNAMVGAFDSNEVEFYSSTDPSTYHSNDPSYKKKMQSSKKVSKETVSSLSASMGDFDHVLDEDQTDERWNTTQKDAPTTYVRPFQSSIVEGHSLEVISEDTESVFDSISTPPLHSTPAPPPPPLDLENSQRRWSADAQTKEETTEAIPPLNPPVLQTAQRDEDEEEQEEAKDSPIRAPSRKRSDDNLPLVSPTSSPENSPSQDRPIRAPSRQRSGDVPVRQDSGSSHGSEQDVDNSIEPLTSPLHSLINDTPIRAPARHQSNDSLEGVDSNGEEEEASAGDTATSTAAAPAAPAESTNNNTNQVTAASTPPAAAPAAPTESTNNNTSQVILPSQRLSASRRRGPAYFTATRH